MKEITINYKGLKIKHLLAIAKFQDDKLKSKVELLSEILEIPKETLYRIDNLNFNTLFNSIMKDIKEVFENKKIKHKIEVNGKQYKLIDFRKQQVGWYIDATTIKLNPETIMALNYIEAEAKGYLELSNENIPKYSLKEREEVMKEASLSDYMALNAFFLKNLGTITNFFQKMVKYGVIKL